MCLDGQKAGKTILCAYGGRVMWSFRDCSQNQRDLHDFIMPFTGFEIIIETPNLFRGSSGVSFFSSSGNRGRLREEAFFFF